MTEKIDQKAWAGDPRWAWAGFMVVTVATLGCAPFMGLLRDALLERFPRLEMGADGYTYAANPSFRGLARFSVRGER